jgi:hypothetical protein
MPAGRDCYTEIDRIIDTSLIRTLFQPIVPLESRHLVGWASRIGCTE